MSSENDSISKKWRWLIILLILLLGISTYINFQLYDYSFNFHAQLHTVKQNPLGLNNDKSALLPESSEGSRVVFFGDSRASMWPSPNDLNRFSFHNFGIGGQTSAQILLRFEPQLMKINPTILVIQMGVNDLKAIPYLDVSEQSIVDSTIKNFDQLFKMAEREKVQVIVTPIFPLGETPMRKKYHWGDKVKIAVEKVNSYIRKAARDNPHLILFDTDEILKSESGFLHEGFQEDHLHLNKEAYVALNNGLLQALQRLENKK